jgi:hypothetical protein
MKTRLFKIRPSRRRPGFTAIVILLALLTVMVMLVMANTAALNRLHQEVKGMEKHQIQRLDPTSQPPMRPTQSATNQPSAN